MKKARRSERGLSLVEVLVAVTVLVVAATVALLLYDQAQKSFKRGENVTEMQEAVRIAFDKLTSDLRLAGFNYNPDGDKVRPDEQIEAAYDTAVVIRADFDAEDATASGTPEASLAGGQFLTVSTGNDEIVAYVLAKPDGSSSDTLTFEADVQEAQRDGDVETINVPNVALVHNDPPYTLYRVSFNNDETTYGSSSFVVRTPLVENVQSMSFRYYNQVGTQVNSTFDLTSTADDIGGAETAAAVNQRGSIRRIGIEVVGLTRNPDLGWVDPDDTNPATRAYRKFLLTGDVTPRNIGMVGIKDLQADITPPGAPGAPTLIPGHCGGLYITWPANPPDDQVTSYRINYGTAAGSYTGQRTVAGTSYYLGNLADATAYYVMLQAADAAGNLSAPSSEVSNTTSNLNTPEAPLNLVGTTDLNGGVRLAWDAVTANTAAVPSQDPNLRDLAGYRVYRGKNPGFPKNSTYLIADESVVGNKTSPDYIDGDVVNCKSYYYQVTAVDTCGTESAPSGEAPGSSISYVAPKAPENVQAFFSGLSTVTVSWDDVVQDVNDDSIFIEKYRIYRSSLMPNNTTPTDASGFNIHAEVTGSTSYVDTVLVPIGYTYWYAVTAVDDCPNESAHSLPARPACAFSGDVVFNSPANNSPVAGVVPVQVEVVNTTDTFAALTLDFYHITNGRLEHQEVIVDPGPVWDYDWIANPPGPYIITATVENAIGCPKAESIRVSAGFSIGCCLSPPDPDLNPIVMTCLGSGPSPQQCKEVTYEMINNNCLTAVAIEAIEISWVDVVGNNAKLTGVRFDGSLIWNVTPPSSSPATNVFTDPLPSIAVDRDSANPVDVTYVFDQVTSEKQGNNFRRDTMTTSYDFRLLDSQGLPTSITGTCGPSTGMFDNLVVEQHN